jgi:hypothetical protein
MGRSLHRLKPLKFKTLPKGLHSDGGNLCLQVTIGPDKTVRRSWIFRQADGNKQRHMGLGSLNDVSLSEARAKAAEQRKLRLDVSRPRQRKTHGQGRQGQSKGYQSDVRCLLRCLHCFASCRLAKREASKAMDIDS